MIHPKIPTATAAMMASVASGGMSVLAWLALQLRAELRAEVVNDDDCHAPRAVGSPPPRALKTPRMESVAVIAGCAPRGRAAFFDRSKLIIAFVPLSDDSGNGFRVWKPRATSYSAHSFPPSL